MSPRFPGARVRMGHRTSVIVARTPAVESTARRPRIRRRKYREPPFRYARKRIRYVEPNQTKYHPAAGGYPAPRATTGPVGEDATPAAMASVPATRAPTTPETPYTRGTAHG